MPKATLEEMADACQDAADSEYSSIKVYEKMNPKAAPQEKAYARQRAFEAAAQLIRIGSVDENAFRAFLAGLLKRHAADGK